MSRHHISLSHSARTLTDPRDISQEIAKYRALKSQGMLNSLPTENSTEFSPSSRFQRTDTSSLSIHLLSQNTPNGEDPLTEWTSSPSQGELAKDSQSKGFAYADSIRKALAHYLANSHKGQAKSPNATILSENSNEKSKTMTPPTPSDVQEADNNEKSKNNSVKAKQERRAPATKTPVKRKTASTAKSSLSTAEKIPRLRSPVVKREIEVNKADHNVIKLSKEVKEWRAFGEKMAKSYEELSKKFKGFIKEKEKAKITIMSLQKQVSTLQSVSTKYEKENSKLKKISKQASLGAVRSPRKGSQVPESVVEELKQENQEIKKTVEFLQNENKVQQETLEESCKEAEYYKQLAQSKFKECSTLAEEIICLRTDLDRSHSNYLRIQKGRGLNIGTVEEIREMRLRRGGLKSFDNSKENGIKKGVSWKDELEDGRSSRMQ